MSRYAHLPSFNEFFGIDLRSSEKTRERGFSGDGCLNCVHTAQGGITVRPGTKNVERNRAQLGLFRFKQTNILGASVDRLIGFGGASISTSGVPYKLTEATFTLTNSHATQAATVRMIYDTASSQYRFKITRGGSTLLDQALGTSGSGTTLGALETLVDALTSFSMSTPASTSTPAVYMQLLNDEVIAAAGGTLTVSYCYWEQANFYAYDPAIVGTKHWAYELGLDSYRNVSAVLLRGVLYVAWGANKTGSINGNTADKYPQIWKYDGQNFYAAGAPLSYGTATAATSAVPVSATDCKGTATRSTALGANAYKYRFRMISVDKAGNRIEGDLSEPISVTASAANYLRLVMRAAAGNAIFAGKSAYAQVNGAATSLTQTVDAGHTLVAGDIGFFYDNGQGRCIQREIASVGATSVVFSSTSLDNDPDSDFYDDGSTPNLRDNAVITNNVRAEIWRTKAGGTEYYFLEEVPHAMLDNALIGAESRYIDEEDDDDNLTDALIEPVYQRSWRSDLNSFKIAVANTPPGRFLWTFNDQLMVSGNDLKPCTIYFSDTDGQEYFPQGTHEFDLPAPVTGGTQCGEVNIGFTQRSTHVVSGSLADFNFRVDEISSEIGCVSHHTICKLEEGVVAWLSERGPYVSYGGRRIEPLGPKRYKDGAMVSRIEPFFTKKYSPTATQPAFKRASAMVLPKDRLYVLFIPFEDPSKPGFGTTSSVIWVFDYGRGVWWQWQGMGCSGGMAEKDDLLYFITRQHDGNSGTTYSNYSGVRLSQQQRALARTNVSDRGQYNFSDHEASITWRWRPHWEALGKPTLFKRFLRNRISSDETRAASSTQMTVYAYFDYDESKYWSDTIIWTTEKSLKLKLRAETCQAMMVGYEQSGIYFQPPIITGYELEAVANFRPEQKE